MDPSINSAGPADPRSWNRYAYTRGDPVNRIDPSGLADFSVTGYCYGCSDDGDGDGSKDNAGQDMQVVNITLDPLEGGGPISAYPKCNPGDSASEEVDLTFIANNYSGAMTAANTIQADLHGINSNLTIDTSALAVTLLQWSASETGTASGWGTAYLLTTQHNYFGAQVGAAGSIPCIGNQYVAGSTNACFPPSMSFSDELAAVLSGVPHTPSNPNPNNLSYLSPLLATLVSNPSAGTATIIQAIADAGWNARSSYGSGVARANVQGRLDCLKQNYPITFK